MSSAWTGDPALCRRVEDLLYKYVHLIDDDDLEAWPDLFVEDGVYRVTTRENFDAGLPLSIIYCDGRGMMADRISALRSANIYEPQCYCHIISAVRLMDHRNDVVSVRSNFVVVRTMIEGETIVFASGRCFDKIVEADGALKFAERTVVLDSRSIDTLLVIPL